MVYPMLYYKQRGGDIQVRGESRKKKSDNAFKTWAVTALTDLTIGIILLILDRLI